jgi:hypothetical protein
VILPGLRKKHPTGGRSHHDDANNGLANSSARETGAKTKR